MRTRRDPLTPLVLVCASLLAAPAACAPPAPAKPSAADSSGSYYPLAAGNSWTYQCSVEGTPQLSKTVTLESGSPVDGRTSFLATLSTRVGTGPSEKTTFLLWEDADGIVWRASSAGAKDAEPVGSRRLAVGTTLGALTVTREEDVNTPATGRRKGLLAETFDRDSPDVAEERRSSWRGRTFVAGVGLVVEADGVGGECVLTKVQIR